MKMLELNRKYPSGAAKTRRVQLEAPKLLIVAMSVECRGHQPLWNCELLIVYWIMRRATSLIHTSEIKVFLNLPSIILILIFVNMKILIMLILFLEQTRGRPTWPLRATWCPRAPRWQLLV